MDLLEKSLKVSEVFGELEVEIQRFTESSRLTCYKGCGLCCSNPYVSASVLEFLPLAFELYRSGLAEEKLAMLEAVPEDSFCILLKKLRMEEEAGFCIDYKNRGLICRLFANSARKNKYGEKELLICRKIKEGKKDQYEKVTASVQAGMEVPVGADFYARLFQIDLHMAGESHPINIAIRKALDAVVRYYYYKSEGDAV